MRVFGENECKGDSHALAAFGLEEITIGVNPVSSP